MFRKKMHIDFEEDPRIVEMFKAGELLKKCNGFVIDQLNVMEDHRTKEHYYRAVGRGNIPMIIEVFFKTVFGIGTTGFRFGW